MMSPKPAWLRDELVQVGTDYSDPANVEAYEARHLRYRNVEQENARVFDALKLTTESTVLDMGTGTGFFALAAAQRCARVFAVDVSSAMLDYARQKARRANLTNIEFHPGGFLTYNHTAAPVDAIVSQVVLHHLPDFWKQIGLQRLTKMLKPGGKFFLMDVVFSFPTADYQNFFDSLVSSIARNVTEQFARDFERHFSDEFSTTDWIMEGLLRRAGFTIDTVTYKDGYLAQYLCTKQ
ncbi:MAG: class I SAM-dependent methyltransferase [Bacillota bacterium]